MPVRGEPSSRMYAATSREREKYASSVDLPAVIKVEFRVLDLRKAPGGRRFSRSGNQLVALQATLHPHERFSIRELHIAQLTRANVTVHTILLVTIKRIILGRHLFNMHGFFLKENNITILLIYAHGYNSFNIGCTDEDS